MKKTYLDIPPAHLEYAMRFGATYDSEDRKYFVVGEVPGELYSYVPKEPRYRDYAVEITKQCTHCGCAMELRERRDGTSVYYMCAGCLRRAPV